MKKYRLALMINFLFMFSVCACELHTMAGNLFGTWQYIDFDASMNSVDFAQNIDKTIGNIGINGRFLYDRFKTLYEQNNLTNCFPQEEPRIPKIIHFIWLGSPLPDILKKYVESWIEKHPEGWMFQLWTDEQVKKMKLINQAFYDMAPNLGMKSDILRYELLYRFGGLYVDTDFQCLQPVDILHHTYDFYSCLAPLDTGCVQVANGLLAACPGHPILKRCIETMKKSFRTGRGVTGKTGPPHFTKSVYALAGKTDKTDVVFPATYFYPFGSQQKVEKPELWRFLGSFGVHWWAKTWNGPDQRPEKFKCIDNYHLLG